MENIKIKLDLNINLDSLTELEKIVSRIEEQLKSISGISFQDILSSFGSVASIGSFLKNIIHTKKSIENEMKRISSAILDEKTGIESAAKKIGSCIGEGLIKGIKGSKLDIDIITYDVFGNIESVARKRLEISSPSKVMKRLGGYIPEGFGDGIKANGKVVKNAMGDITDTVEKSAKKASKTKFSLGGIAAVATVVGTLVGYFVNMLSTNEELSGKMEKVWGKITDALSPVIDAVTSLFDSFINGGEGTSSVLDTVVEVIGGVAEFISEVISQIVGFFQENSDVIGGIVGSIWEFIKAIRFRLLQSAA